MLTATTVVDHPQVSCASTVAYCHIVQTAAAIYRHTAFQSLQTVATRVPIANPITALPLATLSTKLTYQQYMASSLSIHSLTTTAT